MIAFASDHAGLALKDELVAGLKEKGVALMDLGPSATTSVDYPDYSAKVAAEIQSGKAKLGVLVCGTGIGMSISANKFKGIRAALCHTEFEARMTRLHNDANVLCLGQRVTGGGVAKAILDVFLATSFEGGRHQTRVAKISAQEKP